MTIIAYGVFFAALTLISQNNHPTLLLNLIASGIMTLASMAIYVAFSGTQLRAFASLIRIVLAFCIAGTISAILISLVYDKLWGTDPLRFGIGQNIVMDIVVVAAGWGWTVLFRRFVR